jgi:hypothetical protein
MSKEDHTKFFDTKDYGGAKHVNNIFESLLDVRFFTMTILFMAPKMTLKNIRAQIMVHWVWMDVPCCLYPQKKLMIKRVILFQPLTSCYFQ